MNLKCASIMALGQEIEKGNMNAVNEFIINIKKNGTPLIEDIDENYSLVTYIYIGDETTENVILVPDGDGWRKTKQNTMSKLKGTDIFYKSDKVPNDIMFDYRFSVNDYYGEDYDKRWENSVHDIYCPNKLELRDENGDIIKVRGSYVVMKNAPKLYYTRDRNVPNKGSIEKQEIVSNILGNKRNIYVYLPYNYSSSDEPYKALVLTDGNDYLNILNAKNVLDNLIYEGKIPPIVTIFINQTEERDTELACNDKFIDFVIYEVLMNFRKQYNLSVKPEDNTIGGLSLGGLNAAYIGLKHSEVFGNVLSQSGSFWWNPYGDRVGNFIVEEFDKIDILPLKVYLEVGEIEDKEYIILPNEHLREVLTKKGYDIKYSIFKAGHDYLLWGETLANGLIYLLSKS